MATPPARPLRMTVHHLIHPPLGHPPLKLSSHRLPIIPPTRLPARLSTLLRAHVSCLEPPDGRPPLPAYLYHRFFWGTIGTMPCRRHCHAHLLQPPASAPHEREMDFYVRVNAAGWTAAVAAAVAAAAAAAAKGVSLATL